MISIIIPAFNEETNILRAVSEFSVFAGNSGLITEIIVVSDGSTDRTVDFAEELKQETANLMVIDRKENKGKGYSVREGFLQAGGEFVLFSDADLSTPVSELLSLLDVMERGDYDCVIASRALSGSLIEKRQNAIRQLMGMTYNRIVRILTGLAFSDTQCGFKLFKRNKFLPVFKELRTYGFSFDVEIIMRGRKQGLKITDCPVRWINNPVSSVHIVKDSLKMFFDLIRIKFIMSRQ